MDTKRISVNSWLYRLSYKFGKKILNETGFGGEVLIDLLKGFDTLNYEILITKLIVYGLDNLSSKLIQSYLTNRWQSTKILHLLQGVPQQSVLGSLLFNNYLNDLFFLVDYTEVYRFSDDTTFFSCDKDQESLINRLERDSFLAIEWFQNNYLKLNEHKCHFFGGYKHESIWVIIDDVRIWETNKQKLFGVHIDRKLSFDEHVPNLCQKAGRKLSVLAGLSRFMTVTQKTVLMKSLAETQFDYCPLVLMFHGRVLNRKINHLHERPLWMVYNGNI